MATASGFQANDIPTEDHTATPPLAQAETAQISATMAPSQNVSSAAAQETNKGDNTDVPQNSVTISPATHQGPIKWSEWGLSKWCRKNLLVIFIGVILVTIYFVIGYLKSPDRELASIENEYEFCEAHPVRLNTRFQETELTSLLMFHNTAECKENDSLVWKKYGPAPSLIKRSVHETSDQYSRIYTLVLAGSVIVLINGVTSLGPTLSSLRQLLARPKLIRLTRFEKYKALYSITLLFPPYLWTVWLFLKGNWLLRYIVLLQFAFLVYITFRTLINICENRKEQESRDTDQTSPHKIRRCSVCIILLDAHTNAGLSNI